MKRVNKLGEIVLSCFEFVVALHFLFEFLAVNFSYFLCYLEHLFSCRILRKTRPDYYIAIKNKYATIAFILGTEVSQFLKDGAAIYHEV